MSWRETVVTKIGIFFTKVNHLVIKSLKASNNFNWYGNLGDIARSEQCHLNLHCFTKGSKLTLNQGFQNRFLVTTVSRKALDIT